jgi:hypothetical protein
MMYCNSATDIETDLALELILEPLVRIANSSKRRYAYSSTMSGPDGSCGICKKTLDQYVYS